MGNVDESVATQGASLSTLGGAVFGVGASGIANFVLAVRPVMTSLDLDPAACCFNCMATDFGETRSALNSSP
jgi:uncharacterized ion transporter superfamily protein YfcC